VILNLLPNGLAGFKQSSTRRLSLRFVAKINLEQKSLRGYPMMSVMKTIARMIIGLVFAAGLAAAFSTTCSAGPETREKIKEDTKAAVEKTKVVAKEVAAETKELAKKTAEKAKEVAEKTAEVSKEVAAKAKEVAGETKDKVKEAVKEVTQ
jgi:gas vesicle protein